MPDDERRLKKKPYGFVPLPCKFTSAPPVWHDGKNNDDGLLSGEIRCELRTLTPLLVGWDRQAIGDEEAPWRAPHQQTTGTAVDAFLWKAACQAHEDAEGRNRYIKEIRPNLVKVDLDNIGYSVGTKSILCPLRAPWGERPVLLPGDSIKGLLRQELGALLGAPMERVAERSYSYRPNLTYPQDPDDRRLEPRPARVTSPTTTVSVDGKDYPVPNKLNLLRMASRNQQTYFRSSGGGAPLPTNAEPYKGGMGGGSRLPDAILSDEAKSKAIKTHVILNGVSLDKADVDVTQAVRDQYKHTLEHLFDDETGQFSARYPNIKDESENRKGSDTLQEETISIVRAAAGRAFQKNDLVWVEWDKKDRCIVSLGWHYYYRWAYFDTVRKRGWTGERSGLYPLPEEILHDEQADQTDRHKAPRALSPVRRLLGYCGDNEGSKGIGAGDHAQLMGRLSINAAIEIIEAGDTEQTRFLPPTFLKELGLPRPSAVEHYLKQNHVAKSRPPAKAKQADQAYLQTYGDAEGYDQPGELAGRKFYLDREDAYTGAPWVDSEKPEANSLNKRSTLALEASRAGRKFRFTLRFRDLEPAELSAVLIALCPHQFREALGGTHPQGYCSKLGYARPLGWGSVQIEAKALVRLTAGEPLRLGPVDWVKAHPPTMPVQKDWLNIHRCKNPAASDYPREPDKQIYDYHTGLRGEHAVKRRYAPSRKKS
jgi:CRISPR-associated protein (TIGR03986 family)